MTNTKPKESICHCGKDGHALGSVNCPVHGKPKDWQEIENKKELLLAAKVMSTLPEVIEEAEKRGAKALASQLRMEKKQLGEVIGHHEPNLKMTYGYNQAVDEFNAKLDKLTK